MRTFLLLLAILLTTGRNGSAGAATNTADQSTVIIVVGAAGEDEYGKLFSDWADLWVKACDKGGAKHILIGEGDTNGVSDFDRLQQTIAAQTNDSPNALWIVLLGHGTFDGHTAKFNLRGPDFSATNLATWLKPFKRPLALVDCSSSSAPFLSGLTGTNRVIITSTRSGFEQNYSRFGQYMSEAIADPQADLDKDGQTSLLEAFLMASRRVAEFYQGEGRLATEHALIDDNGDGFGTPPDWFRGIRAIKRAKDGAALDGQRAHQFYLVRSEQEQKIPPALRARRDELELKVARLRDAKPKPNEDDYYRQLEPLLVELARISAQTARPQ